MFNKLKIKSITSIGPMRTYDITNRGKDPIHGEPHYVANGCVVHNSIPQVVANRDSPSQSWRKELSDIHPSLLEVLDSTYGEIVYQEQLQRLWQLLAGFTSVEAQKARKAVAKKKGAEFLEVQNKWLTEASKTIGEHQAKVWEEKMRGFARYAFNKCLSGDMLITDEFTKTTKTIREWFNSSWMPQLKTSTSSGITSRRAEIIYANGVKKCYLTQLLDTETAELITLECTDDHRFLCDDDQYHTVLEIKQKDLNVIHYRPYDNDYEIIVGTDNLELIPGFQMFDYDETSKVALTACGGPSFQLEHINEMMLTHITLCTGDVISVSPHMRMLTSRGPVYASALTTDDIVLYGSGSPKMYSISNIVMSVGASVKITVSDVDEKFGHKIAKIDNIYIVCIPDDRVSIKSIAKITKHVAVGDIDTYSIQMPAPDHNYIIDGLVHKNSHAASYALLAYRCMWLKAHFFPEWIAAVLNDCHSKKIPRYIRAAIAEKWVPTDITNSCSTHSPEYQNFSFKAFDINNLSAKFEAHGNVVTMGILQAKGVGESSLDICGTGIVYESIQDFVDKCKPRSNVATILIRLGAFDTLPDHKHRKALYTWYIHYTKKNTKKDRDELANRLISEVDGWTEASILAERQKQSDEFKQVYPKKKVPASILKWMPEANVTPQRIAKLMEDYTYAEILEFEKEYLGYTLSDPMKAYKRQHFITIDEIRNASEDEKFSVFPLECIIVNYYNASTSTGSQYLKLEVSDGESVCTVFVWSDVLEKINPALIVHGSAVMLPVRYNKERDSMSVSKYHTILPLDSAY